MGSHSGDVMEIVKSGGFLWIVDMKVNLVIFRQKMSEVKL